MEKLSSIQDKTKTNGSNWLTIRLGVIIMVVASFICVFFLLIYSMATGRPDDLYFEQIEIADSFNQKDERIYCTITIGDGMFGLPTSTTLRVKWYFGSEQVGAHYLQAKSNEPITIWLEPRFGEDFQPGKYELRIYARQRMIESIEFEVVE